jgi:hypothetical protein
MATAAVALMVLAFSQTARADSGTEPVVCDVGVNAATLTVTPKFLWGPNHLMRSVNFSLSLNANAGGPIPATLSITSIVDNQEAADDGKGGGCGQPTSKQGLDWSPDINNPLVGPVSGVGSLTVATDALTTSMQIRSERCAKEGDRMYTLGVQCCDTTSTPVCNTNTVIVFVKKNQGKKH